MTFVYSLIMSDIFYSFTCDTKTVLSKCSWCAEQKNKTLISFVTYKKSLVLLVMLLHDKVDYSRQQL